MGTIAATNATDAIAQIEHNDQDARDSNGNNGLHVSHHFGVVRGFTTWENNEKKVSGNVLDGFFKTTIDSLGYRKILTHQIFKNVGTIRFGKFVGVVGSFFDFWSSRFGFFETAVTFVIVDGGLGADGFLGLEFGGIDIGGGGYGGCQEEEEKHADREILQRVSAGVRVGKLGGTVRSVFTRNVQPGTKDA